MAIERIANMVTVSDSRTIGGHVIGGAIDGRGVDGGDADDGGDDAGGMRQGPGRASGNCACLPSASCPSIRTKAFRRCMAIDLCDGRPRHSISEDVVAGAHVLVVRTQRSSTTFRKCAHHFLALLGATRACLVTIAIIFSALCAGSRCFPVFFPVPLCS